MKTLRLLNFAAILLLFTPFFQMCSDDSSDDGSFINSLPDHLSDSASLNSAETSLDTTVIYGTSGGAEDRDRKSGLEEFWELITVPGENFTATAFGLFVITILDISEGHFDDIWIGSILIIASLFLTIATMILLLKRRVDRVVMILAVNVFLILAAFVAALLTFDSFSQVKWGYYLYLGIVALLLAQARAFVPGIKLSGNLASSGLK